LSYKVFDEHAKRYDAWYQENPILFECEAKVIRALNLRGKGLSIGIGTGILDYQAPIEIGIDPSVNMLKLALARGVEPIRAVGERLPFRDETFEFVLMTVTLCFLDSPEEALLETRRTVIKGMFLQSGCCKVHVKLFSPRRTTDRGAFRKQ